MATALLPRPPSLRADSAGAPRTALLGVGAGAAFFVVLGAIALAGEDAP